MSFLRMVLLLQIHTSFSDLSHVFDCLSYELLIAKLNAFDFDKLVNSYLTNRKERVRINDKYSSWSETLFGVPESSTLGPLLFNAFICDMLTTLPQIMGIKILNL